MSIAPNMRSLIIVVSLALCLVNNTLGSSVSEWASYKAKHSKKYPNEVVEAMRREIFEETKRKVEHHNEHLSEKVGYKLGINHMSDWTQEEKDKLMNPMRDNKIGKGHQRIEVDTFLSWLKNKKPLPSNVDWRNVSDRVSSVKNQGDCEASWAFAAVSTSRCYFI